MTTHPKADQLLSTLKTHLAGRKDNSFVPGGGDNQSQFYYLPTHSVSVEVSSDGTTSWSKNADGVVLTNPKDAKAVDVRASLTEFYDAQDDKPEVSDENLKSSDWLTQQGVTTSDAKSLLSGVEMSNVLAEELRALTPVGADQPSPMSKDQIDRFNSLANYPTFVSYYCAKACFGVGLLVTMDLDEVCPEVFEKINMALMSEV